MKAYYINLAKNTENQEQMERLFPLAERLEGVNGTALSPKDILPYVVDKDWRDPNWGRRTTKGAVGCILSHLKLFPSPKTISEQYQLTFQLLHLY